MLRHRRDEVFGSRPRRLDILGAHFEYVFEVCAHIAELALQHEHDILVVFALLVCLGVLLPRKGLQAADLLV